MKKFRNFIADLIYKLAHKIESRTADDIRIMYKTLIKEHEDFKKEIMKEFEERKRK
jgi:hypothetical protein